MKRIGLTGGIACGKSTVTRMLRAAGYLVIDVDDVNRAIVQPEKTITLERIFEAFGPLARNPVDGGMNRRYVGERIFQNPEDRARLGEILAGFFHMELERQVEAGWRAGHEYIFIDAAMLFEWGLARRCVAVWTVEVDPETQITRGCERNGITREQMAARVAAQMSSAARIERADRVLTNNGTPAQLEQEVQALLADLKGDT